MLQHQCWAMTLHCIPLKLEHVHACESPVWPGMCSLLAAAVVLEDNVVASTVSVEVL